MALQLTAALSNAQAFTQTFDALRYRNFRLYWFGGIGQAGAIGMQFLIFGWLILELTNSSWQLGLLIFMYGMPNLAMLIFGGIVADRVDRRWLLFYSQSVVAVLIAVSATLTLYQLISIWHLYGIAFILGIIQGINMPARMAIVRDLVDRDAIMNATSLNMAVFNTGRIIGPSLAGWIIQYVGMGHALYFNAVCYGVGCVFLLLMTGVESRSERQPGGVLNDMAEGLRYVAITPIAFTMVGLSFAFGFFGAAYVQVLPAFGKEVLRLKADGAGVLLSAAGIGSLAGNMFIASLGNTRHKSLLLVGMIVLFGITLFIFAWTPWYSVSLLMLFLTGIGFTGFISVGTSILQLTTPPRLLGRMMSLWLIGAAMHYIGALPLGVVADYYSWPMSIAMGALAMMAFVIWLGMLRPTLRRLQV